MILIVDDDADLADTCAMLLRFCGYTVAVALNSKSAIQMMRTKLPQLMLADVFMPEITGVELSAYLKEVYGVVPFPIILMSGTSQHIAAPRKCYDAFLPKPFFAESLVLEVRNLIGPPRTVLHNTSTAVH